ncbi:hypothetical protein LXL04_037914 [Taraxacum kok-saghyz]
MVRNIGMRGNQVMCPPRGVENILLCYVKFIKMKKKVDMHASLIGSVWNMKVVEEDDHVNTCWNLINRVCIEDHAQTSGTRYGEEVKAEGPIMMMNGDGMGGKKAVEVLLVRLEPMI